MEMDDKNKETKQHSGSRRDFLVKAGIAGVPLLMSFKSRATWGSSSLNCGLSATASQIASMSAETGKTCKEKISYNICDINYFGHPHGCFRKTSHKKYKHNNVRITEDARFKYFFGGSKRIRLEDCIAASPSNFERNITYCFLYACYNKYVTRLTHGFPEPDDFIFAYKHAVGTARDDLMKLVHFYVNGY